MAKDDATTTVVELEFGAEDSGAKLPSLTMRRPRVKDQIRVSKLNATESEREVRLFANLCEVGTDVIESLDLSDYRKLQDAYTGFFKIAEPA